MSRRLRRQRGFTLIEVMVAGLIGVISIAVAAKVAQVVIKQSAKGRERTDFHSRTHSVTQQLRADIRVAGLGSTGAIAFVDPGGGIPFNTVRYQTPNGYWAIPAVTGETNVAAVGAGGLTVRANTDLLQLVVPDPSSSAVSAGFGRQGNSTMAMLPYNAGADPALPAPAQIVPPCAGVDRLVYIVDNSGPSGAGRALVAFLASWDATGITILAGGTGFPFTVAPGARVMCARISTYFVDSNGWLVRSDIDDRTDASSIVQGRVMVNDATTLQNAISPGVEDFQIALGMSADYQRFIAAPVDITTSWLFTNPAGVAAPNGGTAAGWSDVRAVRFNVLARTLRKIIDTTQVAHPAAREDGAPPQLLSRGHGVDWISSTEVMTSLKYYDENAPQNLVADPY
ncbi:MAG: prepilin-type N-terminal cleavage/methylation domain-containing protein [Deltaproteobacteria bacterium]|jgi:prepilin-type N-terminal cleavage/methylation domain-containing protein